MATTQRAPAIPIPPRPTQVGPPPIDIKAQPNSPPIRYREDSGLGPGYYLRDIKCILHPEDFENFIREVAVYGELDGEPVVWALEYVRWYLREEER